MSAAKQPGPWWVDVHKNVMAAGGMVAFPCISAGFDQAANARLIAAAPEMLEALRKAAVLLAGACVDSAELEPHEAYEAISAAIAKAEGKS